jgi:acetyltransferase-like isoleucine patch superfamily enzyme
VIQTRFRPRPIPLLRRMRLRLRDGAIQLHLWRSRKIARMDIGRGAKISLRADLDMTNPRGVHIGEGAYIAFHAVVLTHDMSRAFHADTYIGRNCFVGAHAIVMPGVRVGDECIVGAGAVVTSDVPSGSIVGGNPARVIRSGISTRKWGILTEAHAQALAMSLTERAEPR